MEQNIGLRDIYRCRDCGPQIVEFEKHMISPIDEYGRPIHMRMEQQVVCKYCKKPAVLVKRDAKQAIVEAEMKKAMGETSRIDETNEVVIEEPTDRQKPIRWKGCF